MYKLYEREIEGVYRRLSGEEDDGREKREIGGVDDTQKWLMGLVKGIVKDPSGLEIETDLFDFGLDSLQAGRIRLNIQRVSEEFTGFLEVSVLTASPCSPGARPQGHHPRTQLCL